MKFLIPIHFISDSLSETKDRNLYIKELPAMGVDTVIDNDNNLQIKVKEVV